jgi:hypothetical protein
MSTPVRNRRSHLDLFPGLLATPEQVAMLALLRRPGSSSSSSSDGRYGGDLRAREEEETAAVE